MYDGKYIIVLLKFVKNISFKNCCFKPSSANVLDTDITEEQNISASLFAKLYKPHQSHNKRKKEKLFI